MSAYDQLIWGELAGAEALSRYVVQVQQAARRNPKNPDFKGTGLMVMRHLDSSGGILTGDFALCAEDEQTARAFRFRQQVVYAEEEEKRGKGAVGSSGAGGPGKK